MIQMQPLPFDSKALEPYISEKTIQFHYGKHQANYVNTTNALIEGTEMAPKDLDSLILESVHQRPFKKLFNNAAQVWNHQFYWQSLSPQPSKPSKALQRAIDNDFGTLDECIKGLIETGVNHFGSGWVWLVSEGGNLKIISTSNAETPLTMDKVIPLLCLDVWEHAYYLDYQNGRKEHLGQVATHLLNWSFASKNYQKSLG